MQVNDNGFLSFGYDVTEDEAMIHGPLPAAIQVPAIAPFNADINFGAYSPSFLNYHIDTSPEILSRATNAVMAIRQYAQELPDFQATWTFAVTWHDAVFYGASPTDPQVVSLKMTHCSHALFTRTVHTPLEVKSNSPFIKICSPS